jgi:NAD(P)-dependent dehydrogenase (short-subunit alcohol dehydrogenase family)
MNPDTVPYTPAKDLLDGRIILVTGASRGIGRAVALQAARLGATVILHGKNEKRLDAVYDEIEAAGGPQPALAPLDLEKAGEQDYDVLAQVVEAEFGRLDGLVHNAGILGSLTPIELYEIDLWEKVLRVNVTAPFLMTKALMPLLKASADARIVLTSSGVGRRGRAYWGAYAVSKFAIEGFTQVLADELDDFPQIRCNAINPGATRTDMRAAAYPGENPETLPSPEQIAPAYMYLLGPDARHLNGVSLDARTLVGLA